MKKHTKPNKPAPQVDWSEIDQWLREGPDGETDGPVAGLSDAERHELLDSAIAEAREITRSSRGDHWPDVIVLLALFLFGGLAIRQQVAQAPVTHLAIAAAGGLPAFHVIRDADVMERQGAPAAGAPAKREAVHGRYLLQSVTGGAILHDNQLSRTAGWEATLKDLTIVDLPVRLGPVDPPLETRVTLVISPRTKTGLAAWSGTTPLLAIRRASNIAWASVALTKDQLDSLKPLLGDADVYVGRIEP